MRERVGAAIGALWAPAVAAISRARTARMFHPEGHTFTGTAEPACAPGDPYHALAEALRGQVLGRLSAALWRGGFEHLDVLGLALRFRREPVPFDHAPRAGDTDLLAATIRSPLTMLAAPFFTDASDFAGNTYWAVSPFAPPLISHRVELRLVPVDASDETHGTRLARLRAAVMAGRAVWWLEARRTLRLRWHPILRISLEREAAIDQAALRFDPFRGVLHPVGLVHAIRRATYASSQAARPDHEVSGRGEHDVDGDAAREAERELRAGPRAHQRIREP